jgi:GntR family transcriptional regulator, carbon starvation induced regulator
VNIEAKTGKRTRVYDVERELRSHSLIGKTLATDVLHRLREDIVSCVLKPGDRLRFETLREIYGVSFSTLREALSRLASETLVVAEGQRGFIVAPISREDLLDLTDARVLIESETLRRSMERGGSEWKERILSAFHRLDRVEAQLQDQHRITAEWDQAHFTFHEALVSASASATLSEMRRSLFERARRYRRLSALVRKAPRAKRAEHRAMMEAVLSGDVEEAQGLVERHIREIAQNILANGLDPSVS